MSAPSQPKGRPSLDDLLEVMALASVGGLEARVAVDHESSADDPYSVLGHALNILLSDLAHRTRALREGEAKFRTAFTHAAMGIVMTGLDGRFLEANDAAARMFGRTREELVGMHFAEVTHPDDHGPSQESVDRALKDTGGMLELEKRYMRPDGTAVVARVRSSLLRDRDGAPLHFITHILDVTEWRAAEEAARAHRERLDLVLESTGTGLWYADLPMTSAVLSEGARDQLGLDRQTVDMDAFFTNVHPDDVAPLKAAIRRAEETGQRCVVDHRVTVPEGVRWVRHTGRIVHDEAGVPTRFGAVTTDVTEERAAAEEVRMMRAQLGASEKLAALGSLVSGVAHEVRTPLAYLNNLVHLMVIQIERAAKEGESAETLLPKVKGFAEDSVEAVERINRLVKDLRRFTRADPPRAARVPPRRPIEDAIRLFEATMRGRFHFEAELEDVPPLMLDEAQVQQIVINLLQNATDAMESGGTVRVRLRAEGGAALLSVEDSGEGVPESVQPRLFEPLVTSKVDGTGLGLSIVKRIVDTHQGSITWTPRPEGGTRFDVLLRGTPDAS